jgi:hypothetical protein
MIDLMMNKLFDLAAECQTVIVNLELRSAQARREGWRGILTRTAKLATVPMRAAVILYLPARPQLQDIPVAYYAKKNISTSRNN